MSMHIINDQWQVLNKSKLQWFTFNIRLLNVDYKYKYSCFRATADYRQAIHNFGWTPNIPDSF